MNRTGYIYFASNASMPGLLKVGATNICPSERLPELQSTGVPTPFLLESCIRVKDSAQAEHRVHALLAKWRSAPNREFFQISLGEALAQCVPNLTEFLAGGANGPETIRLQILREDEVRVLLFVAGQTKKERRPTRSEIQSHFKFSDVKWDYVLGSLLRQRFVREVSEERESHSDYRSYKVKVVKLEHTGIQHLLDSRLISEAEL